MKLSEALRLGEFALPGVHGNWVERGRDGKPCGGCAVGRMCIAAGFKPKISSSDNKFQYFVDDIIDLAGFMGKTWPWSITHAVKYPAEFWEESSPDQFFDEYDCGNDVLAAISDLYEDAEWSIARIADWVATIEPQDEPTTQPTHEVTHEVLDEPAHSHHDR